MDFHAQELHQFFLIFLKLVVISVAIHQVCARFVASAIGAGSCGHHSLQEVFVLLPKKRLLLLDVEVIARELERSCGDLLRVINSDFLFFILPFLILLKGTLLNTGWLMLLAFLFSPSPSCFSVCLILVKVFVLLRLKLYSGGKKG